MTSELGQYLQNIKYLSRLSPPDENGVMRELEAHIEDEVKDLETSGLSKDEAVKACLGKMGATDLVARRIYEAHCQGSWPQALLAASPHLLFGLLFFLSWWHYIGWLSIVLIITLATTFYGWVHGKPAWVFSWLGYTLLPVLLLGILMLYLPDVWSMLTLIVYIPLALWWLFRLIIQTTMRDWLFSSLMLLPLPVIAGWLLAVAPGGKINEATLQRLEHFAPWIGLSFITLALTILAFLRIRQRALRVWLLALSGLFTVSLVVNYTVGRLNTITFLGLVLVSWGVLLVPAVLERHLGYDGRPSSHIKPTCYDEGGAGR